MDLVIPDSTFYLVFLKDTHNPVCLQKIINAHIFWITSLIRREIKTKLKQPGKQANYQFIQDNKKIIKKSPVYKPEIPLGAIFSKKQRECGETDVIALSFLEARSQNTNFCFILDEHKAREDVQEIDVFRHLCAFMIRTEDFIKDCHCITKVLSKRESFKIIHDMERVDALGIEMWKFDKIKKDIKSC